ncbi:MAG TPA: adenylate/guanylate cyclase domain-containing protein [Acidimicrobiales bacterium]|nr:adenylate/guanylate cyclase domain-containing protein [Acidimicrobiales bacterium]
MQRSRDDGPAPGVDGAGEQLHALLTDLGAAQGDIETALAIGNAEALASDLVLRRGATLSARQVAERSDVELGKVVLIFRDLGVPVADVDAPQFTEGDVVLVDRLGNASTAGIIRGDDLLRVIAGSMERIAEAAVALYVQGSEEYLRLRLADSVECLRTNVAATELGLDIGNGLAAVFRHHMRQTIARQRVIQEGVSRRELARLAIGFVDLVGSTAMQAALDPVRLGEQVTRFEARAFDVIAAAGGRLVKFIGDEIMLAAVDPEAGCRIVTDLVDAFVDDGTQPRAGLVFGEVLFRHGDYYGPVVNLAARLVDAAIPGETLVDGTVVDSVKDGQLAFEPAGRRMLRGFADPVAVWSLARVAN